MALKAVVDTLDDIPQQFHELYSERNGKFELTGVEGIKTQADVDRLQTALNKERTDHRNLRDKFAPISSLDINDVIGKLDRFEELELAAKGKLDDSKLEEIVSTRMKSRIAPLERERDQLKTTLQEREQVLTQYQQKELRRTINDKVREAATAARILPEAIEDALLLAERTFEVTEDGRVVTKDGVGVTPGIEPSVWFTDLQNRRPHWWGDSRGGGATGSRGNGGGTNPWTHEHWNLTEQGKVLMANRSRAEQLAKAAGTSIGGSRPAPRK